MYKILAPPLRKRAQTDEHEVEDKKGDEKLCHTLSNLNPPVGQLAILRQHPLGARVVVVGVAEGHVLDPEAPAIILLCEFQLLSTHLEKRIPNESNG